MSNRKYSVVVLAEREESTMVSTWTEHLCLTKGTTKAYRLFTGQPEVLGGRDEYFNEESGEYELPESIDGKPVVGTMDDFVIGDELISNGDEVEFEEPDDATVKTWRPDPRISPGWS